MATVSNSCLDLSTVFLALLEYAFVNYKYFSKRSKLVRREIIHHMKRIEGRFLINKSSESFTCNYDDSRFLFNNHKAMKALAKNNELPHVTGCGHHGASPLSCTMVSQK